MRRLAASAVGAVRSPAGGLDLLGALSALVALAGAAGCEPTAANVLLLEVRADRPISRLALRLKWSEPGRQAQVFESIETAISRTDDGYVGPSAPEPLRARVELPGSGFFLVHLVATGRGGEVLTSTKCYAVSGVVVDRAVGLAELEPQNDRDGDTFPENLDRHCASRAAAGFDCETVCMGTLAGSLGDCNPEPAAPIPPGCPPPPADDRFNPLAAELCGNCHDEDCDGADLPCPDEDGDGFPSDLDCDDRNPAINPGAEEICGNGIDENCREEVVGCRGDMPCDLDRDGFFAPNEHVPGCGGNDCDDSNPEVHPWAFEGCGSNPDLPPGECPGCEDGIDNNCNGAVDEGCDNDLDQDGVPADLDCNDCDSAVGPGFREICGNGVDEDCDGVDAPCPPGDTDRDGHAPLPAGNDCDDSDPRVYPGAPERCGDGIAQDCVLDLPCAGLTDLDGDFFGAEVDCDDGELAVNPWAVEACDPDGVDENCDGRVNEVLDPERGCVFRSEVGLWSALEYRTDVDHCGRCRNRCVAEPCTRQGEACVEGECLCHGGPGCGLTPTSYCCPADGARPAGCRDLTLAEDCGECGARCERGAVCRPTGPCGRGECVCDGVAEPCPPGPCWECCPGIGCVDVCENIEHCGGCGNACEALPRPAGDTCRAGRCYCDRDFCTGTTFCTDVLAGEDCGCVDLETDNANCGSCGARCQTGESCAAGECACGAEVCEGTSASFCCPPDGCVDLDSDEGHCGSCVRACRGAEQCVAGSCRCGTTGGPCDAALTCCPDGSCLECCGDGDCAPGERCCAGRCLACCGDEHCGPGLQCCEGQCRGCCDGSDCASTEQCCPDGTCAECCRDGDCTAGRHCCDGRCNECCRDADCPSSRRRCCPDRICRSSCT